MPDAPMHRTTGDARELLSSIHERMAGTTEAEVEAATRTGVWCDRCGEQIADSMEAVKDWTSCPNCDGDDFSTADHPGIYTRLRAAETKLANLKARKCETCKWWRQMFKPTKRQPITEGECKNAAQEADWTREGLEPDPPNHGMRVTGGGMDTPGVLMCENTHCCAAWEARDE